MPQRYFETFPVITYSNNQVVDITKRVALLDKVSDNPYVFYPYEISDNERADQLSARYYDDQYKSWMFYITNKIVDPYYEWYLNQNEFVDFIISKYGSYYDAETKVKLYRNNYIGQENITVSAFDSLPAVRKKYWQPNYGYGNRIDSYSRKQVDWITNTNKIVTYTANTTTYSTYLDKNKDFINDEICTIVFDNYNEGKGQILSVTNTTITIRHVSGTYTTSGTVSVTPTSYIYGTESTVNTYFTAVTVSSINLDPVEEVYWAPVSYLEYETEKNEYNKSIRVLDSSLKQTMVDNLKTLMKE